MTEFVLGVDPGLNGAIAILEAKTGKLVQVIDMPVVEVKSGKTMKRKVMPYLITSEIEQYTEQGARAWVEQVSAMPGQGVTSMFGFGESYGLVRGVLAGLRVPVELVPPAKWKRDLNVNSGKDGARMLAMTKWPEHAGEFKRVKDDGRAESALIAHWGLTHCPMH